LDSGVRGLFRSHAGHGEKYGRSHRDWGIEEDGE
jgi:hypothetical protein